MAGRWQAGNASLIAPASSSASPTTQPAHGWSRKPTPRARRIGCDHQRIFYRTIFYLAWQSRSMWWKPILRCQGKGTILLSRLDCWWPGLLPRLPLWPWHRKDVSILEYRRGTKLQGQCRHLEQSGRVTVCRPSLHSLSTAFGRIYVSVQDETWPLIFVELNA